MIGTATPDQTLTSRIIDWFKSDFSRSILLLTGVILIVIIGVTLTSWRVYPLEDLLRMGFIRENNPIGMDTSGFNIDSLDAVKIALQECEDKKVVSISVRPYNEVLLFNRTVRAPSIIKWFWTFLEIQKTLSQHTLSSLISV
jgi:hypothetical protein